MEATEKHLSDVGSDTGELPGPPRPTLVFHASRADSCVSLAWGQQMGRGQASRGALSPEAAGSTPLEGQV